MEMRSSFMWVFLMCYIFGHIIISHNNDFVEAKTFSKFEDREIEKRLKTINKPAVKIIKNIHGERYGCVDFFKQPAFDHLSMNNHSYHYKMRPTWKRMKGKKTNNTGFGYLWENGVGCPIGTVPIRRLTKEDLLRINSFGDDYKPRGSWNYTTFDPNGAFNRNQYHYAVGRTKKRGMKFNGATMELCITAPKVKPNQFSAARLHIQIGNDFIQAGSTVNPGLYHDNLPRTFVYTSAGGKSCYNSNCQVGMISVRQDYPLGSPLLPVSIRGDTKTYFAPFGLIKDEKNGNWWLEIGKDAVEIGFWPSNRFKESSGNLVEWGGEVYSASLPSPQMGFGNFPGHVLKYDAYMKRISILDGSFNVDRKVDYVEPFSDDIHGYKVLDMPDSRDVNSGHIIFYGGPGNI